MTRFPSVDKRPLDLYKLKKAVDFRGGFEKVCKGKKWAEIGRDLGYSGKIMSSLSTSLKNSYQRWLQPYEDYLRIAKPGVQQRLEKENGGPFTPSPSASPNKNSTQEPVTSHQKPHTSEIQPKDTISNRSNADRATTNFDSPGKLGNPAEQQSTIPTLSHPSGSYFTPVNLPKRSYFTPINLEKLFSREPKNGNKALQRPVDTSNHLKYTAMHNYSPINNHRRHDDDQLKRKLSDRQEHLQNSGVDCTDRKSKKSRKGQLTF